MFFPKNNQKCYSCFSRYHDTKDCPDKFDASELFIPKIDRDLLPRFYQLFDLWEKYLLHFSSSSSPTTVIPDIKQIFVSRDDGISYCSGDPREKLKNYSVVLSERVWIRNQEVKLSPSFNEFVASRVKTILLWKSVIDLRDLIFLLSSKKLKMLKCIIVTVNSKVTFSEILRYLPKNIELITLVKTNIEIEESWSDTLFNHLKGQTFEILTLDIKSINFDLDKLAKLMRKKCTKNIEISLNIDIQSNVKEIQKTLTKKLKNYFVEKSERFTGGLEIDFVTYENVRKDNEIQIQRMPEHFKTFALRNIFSQQIRKCICF